jgi:hypothetical protein
VTIHGLILRCGTMILPYGKTYAPTRFVFRDQRATSA